MKRKEFLQQAVGGLIVSATGRFPYDALQDEPNLTKITILHTNDVHSRIDPFPMDGSRNQGLGGAAKRAKMISQIRAQEKNVLLFDCGDIFQGTPYFNFFGGELEFKLMTEMKYDASTMGNHDFDAGIDGFEKQLGHADFPFIVSNYNFSDTILDKKVLPYKIFEQDDLRIGVIGIGIELDGLVSADLYGHTQYLDPIAAADRQASSLKKERNCDYVICLSHLGYNYRNEPSRVSDVILAQNTKNIDLILGGHTHTFMRRPDRRRNLDGHEVIINQAGWAGILLGRIDLIFEKNKKSKCTTCQNKLVY